MNPNISVNFVVAFEHEANLNPTISVNLNVNGEFESIHLNVNGWNKFRFRMPYRSCRMTTQT